MELFCQYFAAVVFPEAEGNSVGFEPDDLMGREVLIKVEWPEDSEYPKVTHYYPLAEEGWALGPRSPTSAKGTSSVSGWAGTLGDSPEQYEGIYTRTLNAVVCGIGGWMPAGILLGEEAKEVSASVPAYAGQIDRDPTVNTDEAPRPDPAPASSRSDSRPRTWRA